jgi:hypothetical protein
VQYWREEGDGQITPLSETAWADWDRAGRLLTAGRDGVLCVYERSGEEWVRTWAHDLNNLAPAPGEAPAWAQKW